ncbi:hypothetical protein [Sphingobium algorifonticola]|uniref:Uncharacterized protein n=1 Tax=Sphingobium algorifonticola TaxID=2008318 RepID=A0A437J712_9SPHN|nr:hypothetical protein [Sphingobium algorifonticola]RVT40837.1 hypothetical protein ENE74_10190 [Sphingobium algorifonticola]
MTGEVMNEGHQKQHDVDFKDWRYRPAGYEPRNGENKPAEGAAIASSGSSSDGCLGILYLAIYLPVIVPCAWLAIIAYQAMEQADYHSSAFVASLVIFASTITLSVALLRRFWLLGGAYYGSVGAMVMEYGVVAGELSSMSVWQAIIVGGFVGGIVGIAVFRRVS